MTTRRKARQMYMETVWIFEGSSDPLLLNLIPSGIIKELALKEIRHILESDMYNPEKRLFYQEVEKEIKEHE